MFSESACGNRVFGGRSFGEGTMSAEELWDVGAAKGLKAGECVQWGFVSLVNGAASILGALIAAIVNVIFWQSPPAGLPNALASVGTVIGLVITLGVVGYGIAAGLKGHRATPEDSPRALLATAGVVLGAAALLVWIVVGIDLLGSISAYTG
jgi:hypothetical protein